MPSISPSEHLSARVPAQLTADHPPVLLVVVDTEEEFDWHAPFERRNTSVEAMRDLAPVQALFEERGVKPTYVVDFPVASQETGARELREWSAAGRCTLGAHLHPWVSPPFDEPVTAANSYPGNLPAALEEAKLVRLLAEHERAFGQRPSIYKAGRYGLGANTPALLARHGLEIDLSCCAGFDLSADGGPDWSAFDPEPYWFGPGARLLELPTTGGFVGWLGGIGRALHRAATRPPLAWARLPGILSRAGALDRLMLSPEGYEPAHHRRLVRTLLARGTRVFTFSFHSPSARPGCTPYVRDASELSRFLDSCRQFLDFFLGELGGVALSPHELRGRLAPPPMLQHGTRA